MDDYRQLNERSRAELAALAGALSDADLLCDAGDGWTVATVFAHLAFWDRLLEVRWQRALADGVPVSQDLEFSGHIINEALDPLLPGVEPRFAVDAALRAAESINAALAALPEAALRFEATEGLRWTFDRSIHRREHVEQIRAVLGRS